MNVDITFSLDFFLRFLISIFILNNNSNVKRTANSFSSFQLTNSSNRFSSNVSFITSFACSPALYAEAHMAFHMRHEHVVFTPFFSYLTCLQHEYFLSIQYYNSHHRMTMWSRECVRWKVENTQRETERKRMWVWNGELSTFENPVKLRNDDDYYYYTEDRLPSRRQFFFLSHFFPVSCFVARLPLPLMSAIHWCRKIYRPNKYKQRNSSPNFGQSKNEKEEYSGAERETERQRVRNV